MREGVRNGEGVGEWKVGWLDKQHSDSIYSKVKIVYVAFYSACQVSGSGVEIYVGTVVVWRAYAHGRIWARRLRRNLCVSVNKL